MTKDELKHCSLYKRIIDKKNIFQSIYAVDSFIFEKDLLSNEDFKDLLKLKDVFDEIFINDYINQVQKLIHNVLIEDSLFECSVFFRPKKIQRRSSENDELPSDYITPEEIESRPIHSASLCTQIAIASILNSLLHDVDENNESQTLNELGTIFPANFYGNIPSDKARFLFVPWQQKYKEYSNVIHDSYERYLETKEYSHEVMLDLVNFFPSIQPIIVYNFIIKKLCSKYSDNDFEFLKITLIKLLYLKVVNIKGFESKYYHGCEYSLETNYTQGIPQGLPQAYFFSNICMIKVSELFNSVFKGESFYYVDDSVIYTNIFQDINENEVSKHFSDKLKYLNQELEKINISDSSVNLPLNSNPDILALNNKLEYKIKIHENEKSEISTIDSQKLGSVHLSVLSKIASLSSFELLTIFTDEEEITLRKKFAVFQESIEAEIERIEKLHESVSIKFYKKYLIRYKKFMKFRERLLEQREREDIDNNFINDSLKKFDIFKADDKIEASLCNEFFKEYTEDILVTELSFIIHNVYDQEQYNRICETITKFESSIFGEQNKQYFGQVISTRNPDNNIETTYNNKYRFLQRRLNNLLPYYTGKHTAIKEKKINDYSSQTEHFFEQFSDGFKNLFSYITKSDHELYRMCLNAYFSKIFDIELNDSLKIHHLSKKNISYDEFRILCFIRNKHFKLQDFNLFLNSAKLKYKNNPFDFAITEVIDYFQTFIKNPILIDHIIQIHKYTSDLWKNGSKFLHFYTLHNQEHAIELIKGLITFLKNVDYFQISKFDYYILFISCYLHDISMALHPDLHNSFINRKNADSNLIAMKYKEEISNLKNNETIDLSNINKLLLTAFKKVDVFFENAVRNMHANKSAEFIRKSHDLDLIERSIREVVAEVSESHSFDTSDIYSKKSNAKNTLVSKKYMSVLLRVADLLDVGEGRVTTAIMNNHESYMNETTRFHWRSHLAIEGFKINTTYTNTKLENNKDEKEVSFLSNGSINENIEIVFFLNIKNKLSFDGKKCTKCIKVNNINEADLLLKIDIPSENIDEDCSLLCKWMVTKNEYLIKELTALQKYLGRTNNFFNTQFSIRFVSQSDAKFLKNKDYTELNTYLLKK
ncbi:hypothetical protein ADMFC3_11580 [Geovibrio sp. ADMFC3]